ncbi:MAG: 2Fe-2S iron-sulfur cluster-binding protein [Kiloniellales bacterium]
MRRLPDRGEIDRARPLRFRFDGRALTGYAGDSLASALLANGVRLVGRSFKYHRPRGIYAAGLEEPNALVSIGRGDARRPNIQATAVPLSEGLEAVSQNRWPSLHLDLQSLTGLAAPLTGAGFYYKTFMGPNARAWMLYEHFIRKAAGLGPPPTGPDPRPAETLHAHCRVLVVGAGLAGIAAALEAAREGDSVLLVERDSLLGGAALSTPPGSQERAHLETLLTALAAQSNVQVLTNTQVFGTYDHGCFAAVEEGEVLQLWLIRAERAVLASGALERGFVFPGNDRPGVMLAGAARTYLNRYGVLCGERAVVFQNNDSGEAVALELAQAGAAVTLVDPRENLDAERRKSLESAGIILRLGSRITAAFGRRLRVVEVSGARDRARLPCDLLCLAGGWSPVLHLASQAGARPRWSDPHAAFLPGSLPGGMAVVGAAAGDFRRVADGEVVPETGWSRPLQPLWRSGEGPMAFVDLQNDVTAKDVRQAHDEGFVSVEHLKRYTTLGMGSDQGRTSNVLGLALMAEASGRTIAETGTTTFRPPYAAVSLGALAGAEVGGAFHLRRRTPLDSLLREEGAVMTHSGLWERAWYFRENGPDLESASCREMEIVRSDAAISDVSTLGKFEIEGPDAAELLNRLYCNGWSKLAVGKARWGVMLRDDGYVFDDGTTARLGETRYVMTTTTAKAEQVLSRIEFLLQTAWRDLRVQVCDVTDHWAAIALSGPNARKVLAKLIGAEQARDLPFLGLLETELAGAPVRLIRVSFSGELGYEVYCPAQDAPSVWRALRRAGAGAYGLEALGALRIEKGHVSAGELDGRTTLDDLGLAAMASRKKAFVGQVMAERPGLQAKDRKQLVGLTAETPLSSGAVLSFGPFAGLGEGRITAATWSPSLGCYLALALLRDGRAQHGREVAVHDPARGRLCKALVRDPHFLDPEGVRQRG